MAMTNSDKRDAIMREMESLSTEARAMIDQIHPRPRFDLSARRGWQELQEATISGRVSENTARETLVKLRGLCVKWLRLYRELRFVASTRPVWNS